MILEFKIKNFLSFKDEEIFSFEATKDKSYEDYQVVEINSKVRILRLALVYGANASGKSNLVFAFEFIQKFVFNITDNKDQLINVSPFMFDRETPNQPSEFSLIFYIGQTKYLYNLQLDSNVVYNEELYMYPSTQKAYIFKRSYNNGVSDIKFNNSFFRGLKAAKNEIVLKCLTNMSVLAAYNQVNVLVPELEEVVNWIKLQFLPSITPKHSLLDYSEENVFNNDKMKNYILNILSRADFNIVDFKTEIIKSKISDKEIKEPQKDTNFLHKIVNKDGKEEIFTLNKDLQSLGTLRTFGIAGIMHKAIESNAFLAVDEVETSLHPKLIEFLIEDFFKQNSRAQLLLTTHYDGLLDEEDLLRKDSIWFTNKKDDGSTELYSLVDFKALNRLSSIKKAYKYGKFGAIPEI